MKRLLISITILVAIVSSVLLASALVSPSASSEASQAAQAEPPHTKASPVSTPPYIDQDVAAHLWSIEMWVQGVLAEEQRVAEEEAAYQEYLRSRRTVTSTNNARVSTNTSQGSCNGDVECFLACTRAHESDTAGGYSAISPGGTYRGAYQFVQPTWDAAVAGAGYPEYIGVPAEQVPSYVQDAAAAHLYSVSGTRPWGGRC